MTSLNFKRMTIRDGRVYKLKPVQRCRVPGSALTPMASKASITHKPRRSEMKLKFLPFLLPLAIPLPSFSEPEMSPAVAQVLLLSQSRAAADDYAKELYNSKTNPTLNEAILTACLLADDCMKNLIPAFREQFVVSVVLDVKEGRETKASALNILKGLRLSVQDPGTLRMIALAEGYINSLKEF